MSDRHSLVKITPSTALQPRPHETLFCKTLVVGNTIAAYVATLAILQAGEQVCWVQTDDANAPAALPPGSPDIGDATIFSWRWGRRLSIWDTAHVLSQTQAAYWAKRSVLLSPTAAPTHETALAIADHEPGAASNPALTFQQAIAPYLQNQQLLLVTQAQPLRVLYSETRGQRRVFQVVFQQSQQQPFQVHAKLTLDATVTGQLQSLLPPLDTSAAITPATPPVEPVHTQRRTFFKDAIALVMGQTTTRPHRPHPISIPLHALLLPQTDSLLSLSHAHHHAILALYLNTSKAQWALGESLGNVAAWAVKAGGLPALQTQPHWQWHLQCRLVQRGIPLFAFDDVPLDDPDFEAIQMVAIANVVRTMCDRDLSFRPETPLTRAVLASALTRLPALPTPPAPTAWPTWKDLSPSHWAYGAIQQAIALRLLPPPESDRVAPNQVLSQQELWHLIHPLHPDLPPAIAPTAPTRRRHLSRLLYPVLVTRLSSTP